MGEDGILDFLTSYLDISNKIFLEMGVQDYKECNTRFLLIKKNWTGHIVDCEENLLESIKQQ